MLVFLARWISGNFEGPGWLSAASMGAGARQQRLTGALERRLRDTSRFAPGTRSLPVADRLSGRHEPAS
jgi:hypothetical protein